MIPLTAGTDPAQWKKKEDRAIRGGTDVMLGATGNDAILTDTTSGASAVLPCLRQMVSC